ATMRLSRGRCRCSTAPRARASPCPARRSSSSVSSGTVMASLLIRHTLPAGRERDTDFSAGRGRGPEGPAVMLLAPGERGKRFLKGDRPGKAEEPRKGQRPARRELAEALGMNLEAKGKKK